MKIGLLRMVAVLVSSPAFASSGARAAWLEVGQQAAIELCRGVGTAHVEAEVNFYDPDEVNRTVSRECAQGATAVLLSSTASLPDGLPLHALVRTPDFPLPDSVRVGQPIESVRRSLGAPDQVRDQRWIYELSESGDQLEVEVDGEVIVSVSWSFYAG